MLHFGTQVSQITPQNTPLNSLRAPALKLPFPPTCLNGFSREDFTTAYVTSGFIIFSIFLLSKNTKTKGRGIWWCLQQQQLINELFLGGAAGIRRAAL